MRAVVLINRSAGSSTAPEDSLQDIVGKILTASGIEPEFRYVAPLELQREVASAVAQRVELVVACGGDGTVSSVASGVVGTDVILGVVPLGTLNHFAKDLNIPLDLAAAAQVLAAGCVKTIDVGEVNDRIFINNSSLGVYSQLALERDAQRKKWGIGKWFALCLAGVKMLVRFPMVNVRLEADEKSRTRRSPVVFVGNNEYQFDPMRVGTRLSLDEGQLSLYVANTQSRWGILRLTLRALLGGLPQAQDLEASKHTDVWVTSRRRTLMVAADGEVVRMQPPLHYRIRPQSLRVCVPASGSAPCGAAP